LSLSGKQLAYSKLAGMEFRGISQVNFEQANK